MLLSLLEGPGITNRFLTTHFGAGEIFRPIQSAQRTLHLELSSDMITLRFKNKTASHIFLFRGKLKNTGMPVFTILAVSPKV